LARREATRGAGLAHAFKHNLRQSLCTQRVAPPGASLPAIIEVVATAPRSATRRAGQRPARQKAVTFVSLRRVGATDSVHGSFPTRSPVEVAAMQRLILARRETMAAQAIVDVVDYSTILNDVWLNVHPFQLGSAAQ